MKTALTAALAALIAGPLLAHEFWIDPVEPQVDPGGTLQADIRVGENFAGSAYAFLPPNFERFDLVMGEEVIAVEGRPGDRPALNMPAPGEGLVVVVHETRAYDLTYDGFERFKSFLEHKDALWALERAEALGLDPEAVQEVYIRYGKSLMAVGDGEGSDREVGLLTEVVAEANPYTDDLSAGLPVRVLYEGAPRADAQVELWARAPDDSVTVEKYRTDAEGRVTLPMEAGMDYLVDAVVYREVEPASEDGAHFESLWASLTFAVPD